MILSSNIGSVLDATECRCQPQPLSGLWIRQDHCFGWLDIRRTQKFTIQLFDTLGAQMQRVSKTRVIPPLDIWKMDHSCHRPISLYFYNCFKIIFSFRNVTVGVQN